MAETHVKQPREAHQRLFSEVQGVCGRFEAQGVNEVEVIAVLAQIIGHRVFELSGQHSPADILRGISLNIATGNQAAGQGGSSILGMGKAN